MIVTTVTFISSTGAAEAQPWSKYMFLVESSTRPGSGDELSSAIPNLGS